MFTTNEFQYALAGAVNAVVMTNGATVDRLGNITRLTQPGHQAVADHVFNTHRLEIADYLNTLWEARGLGTVASPQAVVTGGTNHSLAVALMSNVRSTAGNLTPQTATWQHLMYAHLLENTRIYEIFQRVLNGFLHGESLGIARPITRQWLQATEALFYRQQDAHDHLPFTTLTSDARGDGRAIRRNAYYRLFGMDLVHGTDDNKPYSYTKPEVANKQFVATLEALLRETWTAFEHQPPSTAADSSDPGTIQDLTLRLRQMLGSRRINQTLSEEEFSAVMTLDWLRLAVSYDSPIVVDLNANAASEAERLTKIGARVGLPAHSLSEHCFELAAPLATMLSDIEAGTIIQVADYLAMGNVFRSIVTRWSTITGRSLKGIKKPVGAEAA